MRGGDAFSLKGWGGMKAVGLGGDWTITCKFSLAFYLPLKRGHPATVLVSSIFPGPAAFIRPPLDRGVGKVGGGVENTFNISSFPTANTTLWFEDECGHWSVWGPRKLTLTKFGATCDPNTKFIQKPLSLKVLIKGLKKSGNWSRLWNWQVWGAGGSSPIILSLNLILKRHLIQKRHSTKKDNWAPERNERVVWSSLTPKYSVNVISGRHLTLLYFFHSFKQIWKGGKKEGNTCIHFNW